MEGNWLPAAAGEIADFDVGGCMRTGNVDHRFTREGPLVGRIQGGGP